MIKQTFNDARQAIVDALCMVEQFSPEYNTVNNVLKLYDGATLAYYDADHHLLSNTGHYADEPLALMDFLSDAPEIKIICLVVDGKAYSENCEYVVFLITNMHDNEFILYPARALVTSHGDTVDVDVVSLLDCTPIMESRATPDVSESLDQMLRVVVGIAQQVRTVLKSGKTLPERGDTNGT